MKNIFKIMALATCLLCFAACDDGDDAPAPGLEVTPANLNGTWMLAQWNGAPLAEGLYLYITFNRREQTFEMYQKFDSMYARFIPGVFKIEKDDYLGAVISGEYDFGNGAWSHEYIVTDLLADSMTWTAKDDAGDVHKFVRCEKVPDEVVSEARPDVEAATVPAGFIL